jgi:CRP-like cAMP-binding protein
VCSIEDRTMGEKERLWHAIDPERALVRGHGSGFLAPLPAHEADLLFERMERAVLDPGVCLFEAGETLRSVYFPVTSVVSLLVRYDDGRAVEAATVGREGVVGLAALMDSDVADLRAVVQMGGEILRVPVDRFRAISEPGSKLGSRLRSYTSALLFQMSLNVGCGSLHPVRRRLARWLLQTADRSGNPTIELTQEFLAGILGVRRASVTDALRDLEGSGGIVRRRGAIVIEDHARLAAEACDCYDLVRRAHDRLLRSI